MRLGELVLNCCQTIELVWYFHVKSGLLTDGADGKSSAGPCTANRCFFFVSLKSVQRVYEGFRGKLIGILWNGYTFSEWF